MDGNMAAVVGMMVVVLLVDILGLGNIVDLAHTQDVAYILDSANNFVAALPDVEVCRKCTSDRCGSHEQRRASMVLAHLDRAGRISPTVRQSQIIR